jgi:hypothetical protein
LPGKTASGFVYKKVKKNAKDGSESNAHAMALLLMNLMVPLGAYPTS